MQCLRRNERGAINHGRWLVPVLVFVIALAGFPAGPLEDNDHAKLYRGGGDLPFPVARMPDPTATPTAGRALLNVEAATVTPQHMEPTATDAPEPASMIIPASVRERARERADAAYAALWEHFYLPDDRLFRETTPYDHRYPYAYVWPLSQTLGLSNEMAVLPDADPQHLFDVLSIVGTIERYYDDQRQPAGYASYITPPIGHDDDRFYDDNAWIGLELVRAYELTGYDLALERAGQVFDFIVSGWDADEQRQHPGGVFWVETTANLDRNAVSTAPSAKLGLLLAELEDDPARRRHYLEWSKRMYDWVEASLRSPSSLYWDKVRQDGTIDEAIFTYTQGSMIGASLLLHHATGDEHYLDRAEQIGKAAIERWSPDGLLEQPVAFNAIFFRNLLLLNDQRPDPAYVDLLVAYSDSLWERRPNSASALFSTGDLTSLLNQSGAASIYAMLAGYAG